MALPLADQLVVIGPDGAVAALDAGGRRLWEALQAGWRWTIWSKRAYRTVACRGRWRAAASRAPWCRGARWASSSRRRGPRRPPRSRRRSRRAARGARRRWMRSTWRGTARCGCAATTVVLAEVIDAACRSCRIEDDGGAAATVDVIEQDGWFAVRADDALLARDRRVRREIAPWRVTGVSRRCSKRPAGAALARHPPCLGGGGGRALRGVSRAREGSGKSTLAAALVAAGADFVTDDYAPLEQASWHVWPVPYAPGIKRGSWRPLRRHYPDLDAQAGASSWPACRSAIWSWTPARMAPLSRGLPVAALVFPRYKTGAGLEAAADHRRRGAGRAVPRQVDAGSASPRSLRRPCAGSRRCRRTG